jgi:hypothetical protein
MTVELITKPNIDLNDMFDWCEKQDMLYQTHYWFVHTCEDNRVKMAFRRDTDAALFALRWS